MTSILKSSVILFPGQGTQYVGMVKNLCPKGQSLFEMAGHVLGYDLLKMCREGPEDMLNQTIHCQPAVFVASMAAVENLAAQSRGAIENCVATAGFSLGEFSSLVLAQSIDFVDALRVIKIRAEITQELGEKIPSGMATILFSNNSNVNQAVAMAREFCLRSGLTQEESVCSIANHLFPHGKVIGGHQVALDFLERNGADFGIKKMKRLAVSAAFHTDILRPAHETLAGALTKIAIKTPKISVYSNVDADVYKDPSHIRRNLAKHVYKPVLWEQSIRKLYQSVIDGDDYPATFECGPQNTMTTMLGMINLKAKKVAYNIEP